MEYTVTRLQHTDDLEYSKRFPGLEAGLAWVLQDAELSDPTVLHRQWRIKQDGDIITMKPTAGLEPNWLTYTLQQTG